MANMSQTSNAETNENDKKWQKKWSFLKSLYDTMKSKPDTVKKSMSKLSAATPKGKYSEVASKEVVVASVPDNVDIQNMKSTNYADTLKKIPCQKV